MAAEREDFYRRFREGFWSQLQTVQPGPETPQGRCGGDPRPCGRFPGHSGGVESGWRENQQLTPGGDLASGSTEASLPTTPLLVENSPSRENVFERLPSEVLFKILSYLDAPSLCCLSQGNKRFHQLANDSILWQRIYMFRLERPKWKLKWEDDSERKGGEAERTDLLLSPWKKMYFKTMAVQELNKWGRMLRDTCPYTGLPLKTAGVLRNVNWELTMCCHSGQENTLDHSQAHFFESSVILSWSGLNEVEFNQLSYLKLYGIRKEALMSSDIASWRSLIFKLDVKTHLCHFLGCDSLVKLYILQPGVVIGMWRGQDRVSFVWVSLHFHKLVEKSLLGSPGCPYLEPVCPPPVGDSDPELGLRNYSLHLMLHNTDRKILLAYFDWLSCRKDEIWNGQVQLRVIDRTNLSQHRSLSGSFSFPWKSYELDGAVENCCFMSLTLLDEFQKPFWCVSSPVYIRPVMREDYGSKNFLLQYQTADGGVLMQLVRFEEQNQFLLIALTVSIPVEKINSKFNRTY